MWTQIGGLTNRSRGHRRKPSRPDRPEQGTSQGGALGYDYPDREDDTRLTAHSGLLHDGHEGVSLLLGKSMGTDASLTLLLPD